jgi:hypothetical protein
LYKPTLAELSRLFAFRKFVLRRLTCPNVAYTVFSYLGKLSKSNAEYTTSFTYHRTMLLNLVIARGLPKKYDVHLLFSEFRWDRPRPIETWTPFA